MDVKTVRGALGRVSSGQYWHQGADQDEDPTSEHGHGEVAVTRPVPAEQLPRDQVADLLPCVAETTSGVTTAAAGDAVPAQHSDDFSMEALSEFLDPGDDRKGLGGVPVEWTKMAAFLPGVRMAQLAIIWITNGWSWRSFPKFMVWAKEHFPSEFGSINHSEHWLREVAAFQSKN